ncbi:hypothetical protein RvY_05663-2 [Ramazzottius varieornatus]|uniref:Fork-head domain-containing protein n=1 Tax=Ramazzottius varieornatus TaxID=947166 RepID=A0A1D1UVV0_RAMVA|nr:hypothetical protein RvY_05663-2 [Ramazzottius varieornatus]
MSERGRDRSAARSTPDRLPYSLSTTPSSTSSLVNALVKNAAASLLNGNYDRERNGRESAHSLGSEREKSRNSSSTVGSSSTAAVPGAAGMNVNSTVGNPQLQQIMQQMSPQQMQLMQQQYLMLQQEHLLQSAVASAAGDKSPSSSRDQLAQQLAFQQQYFLQQLQQARYFVPGASPFMFPTGSAAESSSSSTSRDSSSSIKNDPRGDSEDSKYPISSSSSSSSSPAVKYLYGHGVCRWLGCETPFENTTAFSKHLNKEHGLDDRSTASTRVQIQVVSQLEVQLQKEKDRLDAMLSHLHMKPDDVALIGASETIVKDETESNSPTSTPPKVTPSLFGLPLYFLGNGSQHSPTTTPTSQISSASRDRQPSQPSPPSMACNSQRSPSPSGLAIRRRVSDKANLPIAADLERNRELYRTSHVRPPYTYASLIRQAIIESPERQLTLNEIYMWFQTTFAYFRKNAATWKNAVRHNLSLHKCFARVENVKGAVWTVDEEEFFKRRPQRIPSAKPYSMSGSMPGMPVTMYGEPYSSGTGTSTPEPMADADSSPQDYSNGSFARTAPFKKQHQFDMHPGVGSGKVEIIDADRAGDQRFPGGGSLTGSDGMDADEASDEYRDYADNISDEENDDPPAAAERDRPYDEDVAENGSFDRRLTVKEEA